MSLFLTFDGRVEYNRVPGSAGSTRIVLMVKIGGQLTTAYLDTGMPCVICPPDVAETLLNLNPADGVEIEAPIRGVEIKGRIHNANVDFVVDEGFSPLIHGAMIFVPDNAADVGTDLVIHSFLGMRMCLDSICFGVDTLVQQCYLK